MTSKKLLARAIQQEISEMDAEYAAKRFCMTSNEIPLASMTSNEIPLTSNESHLTSNKIHLTSNEIPLTSNHATVSDILISMDVKQVEEMLKASMNCVSFAPTHANKTNLTLFKSKYDQHSKKIPGPGPRDVMLMDARLKENAFAFQWHIKYNHKGTLGYTRYFGSAKDVIEFYEKHYSKCDVADRNGYEYYYDTLKVKAGFDVEQYSIFTDDLDKEAIVQKVLAAALLLDVLLDEVDMAGGGRA